MMFNPFTALGAKILGGTSLLLAIALAGSVLWGKAGWHQARSWKQASQAQEAAIVAVTEAAKARDIAQRSHHARTNRTLLAQVEAQAGAARSAAGAAVARYASAHPAGLCTPGAGGAPGRSAPAPVPGPAPVDDRGSNPAQLVAVTRADLDLLSGAAVRAAINQQTAQALIDAGLAVAEDVPGPEF